METIIEARDITYQYEDGTQALKGINLKIEKGKKVAFMGANGSGKSTFFLTLNGIHKPFSGTLLFKGTPLNYSRKELLKLRSKVGIVFQDPDSQLFSSSVIQEISFGVLNLGQSEEEARRSVDRIIEEMSLTTFKNKPTHALSGGQKKQVAIADILVMEPEVVILDEPTSNLDPRHTTIVNNYIDTLSQKGITVIIATHDMNYAYRWADEIIVFHEGCVLLQGNPQEVVTNKDLLMKANLEQPEAVTLFQNLQKANVLPEDLPLPYTLETIEQQIIEALKKGKINE